jgi:type 1 glutamine amidotransferase
MDTLRIKAVTGLPFLLSASVLWVGGLTARNTLAADAAAEAQARVLIVTGEDPHNWRETAPALKALLAKDRRLQVEVTEDLKFLADPKLHDYDALVLHFSNWEHPNQPGKAAQENLQKAVANGTGVVVVHFASAAFRENPEFRKLVGRAWDAERFGHDPGGKFRVEITDVEHPITDGMESFETEDELYYGLIGKPPITVLAKARSKIDGKEYPMAFVYNYGKGRGFHCPLGHNVKAFETPAAGELFRRGTAWAAGLSPVPK